MESTTKQEEKERERDGSLEKCNTQVCISSLSQAPLSPLWVKGSALSPSCRCQQSPSIESPEAEEKTQDNVMIRKHHGPSHRQLLPGSADDSLHSAGSGLTWQGSSHRHEREADLLADYQSRKREQVMSEEVEDIPSCSEGGTITGTGLAGEVVLPAAKERTGEQDSSSKHEKDSICYYWELAPLWSNEEEEHSQTMIVDFNTSLCRILFGQKGHRAFLAFVAWSGRLGLGYVFRFLHDVALLASCLTLVVGERLGTPLSVVALLGALPANMLLLLGLNPPLLRKVANNAEILTVTLLMLLLWTVVGFMLGGWRGVFLSAGTAFTGVLGGPMENSWHCSFRSGVGVFFSFLVGILLCLVLAGSVGLGVFRGGEILRWPLGSRYLSGEDIVIHSAATIAIYLFPQLVRSSRSMWRRFRKPQSSQPEPPTPPVGAGTGEGRRLRVLPCSDIKWPLVLQRVEGRLGSTPSNIAANSRPDPAKQRKQSAPELLVPLIIVPPKPTQLESDRSFLAFVCAKLSNRFNHFLLCLRAGRKWDMQGSALIVPESPEHPSKDVGTFFDQGRQRKDRLGPQRGPIIKPHLLISGCGVSCGTLSPLYRVAVQSLILAGVMMIPASYYVAWARRAAPQSSSLQWLSPAVSATVLLWNIVVVLYLSSLWNYQLLRLVLKFSFDFWFLVGQSVCALLSIADAFQYDERCLPLLAWCLLFISCLLTDCMVPPTACKDSKRRPCVAQQAISKHLLGVGVLLPLMFTKAWFLYELFYGIDSLNLRFRTIFHIRRYLEMGAAKTEDSLANGRDDISDVDYSTDSFIIARLTSIIVFSLPLLYHLAVVSCSHNWARTLQGKRTSSVPQSSTLLYFLTGSVSYRVLAKGKRRGGRRS